MILYIYVIAEKGGRQMSSTAITALIELGAFFGGSTIILVVIMIVDYLQNRDYYRRK